VGCQLPVFTPHHNHGTAICSNDVNCLMWSAHACIHDAAGSVVCAYASGWYVTPRKATNSKCHWCRLEIGLQSIYEDVARDTNRGHTVAAVGDCFQLAKDAGFKAREAALSCGCCSS